MIFKTKNTAFFIGLTLLFGCGQGQPKPRQTAVLEEIILIEPTAITPDTLALSKAFEDLQHNQKFIEEMLLDDGYAQIGEIVEDRVFGDLDDDGITDALISFIVHNRGGGNNWTTHYAVFLGQEENKWDNVGLFNSGGSASDYYVVLNKIDNGKISGYHTPQRNSDYRDSDVPVEYIYQDRDLVKTFLKLHNIEDSYNNYLYVEAIQTSNNQNIPTTGMFKDYQNILGEKEPDWPEEEPEECGSYYDYEDFAGLVFYPFLTLEINEANEAAVVSIILQGSDYKIQTDKGTITAKTTLNEILSIFGDLIEINRSDRDKNKIVDLRIPIERYNTKDVWILYFNEENRALETVSLLMGCK